MPETSGRIGRARRRPERIRQPVLRRVGARGRVLLTVVLPLRILGVDPGSERTGWALVTGSVHAPVVVECGEIRMSRKDPLAVRLSVLAERLTGVVSSLSPSTSAVEAPFHGTNARSALQLAHARGVILGVLGRAGVAPFEYPPATVKKTVCGSGRADKEQVRSMVSRLTRIDLQGVSSDVADAIAVALCHQAHLPQAGRR